MLNKLDGVRQSSWNLWVAQTAHTLSTSSIVCIFSKYQRFWWGGLNKYIFTTLTYNLIYNIIYTHTHILTKITISPNQAKNNIVKLLATHYNN